ncbi:MAG TPA: ATP-binding protein [Methylibium sp.]|nr:ATP-binding protein [Methylibium sp.]
MIVSSFGPRGRYPLYRGLALALALCALLAALGLWAALESQRQFELPLGPLLERCRQAAPAEAALCRRVEPLGRVLEQRLAVLLLLQGLCAALIVVGVALIGHRAYHVLVRRTRDTLELVPPAARERGRDEVERLVEGLAELTAQTTGAAAADRWQARVNAEQFRRNGLALHALHQAVRLLAQGEASEASLRQALRLLEAALGARTVALQLHGSAPDALGTGPLIATRGEPQLLSRLASMAPATRDSGARAIAPTEELPCSSLVVPLARDGVPIGTLVAEFAGDERLDDPQAHLAESFARLAALAISSLSRRQEERRMVLMEERGAIAAELHDSLAQALSYMKIQVARLQAALDRDAPREEVRRTADELREGLAAAYREVRELIAAFRVRVGPGGLRAALQEAIDGFGQRSGLEIAYTDGMAACRLEPNEELHVLQLVREAIANAVRHAQAGHVWVDAQYRADEHLLIVSVEDDGQGLDSSAVEAGHYGLGIMRERARSLRGECSVEPRAGGGTRVRLSFAPARFPADPPATEPAP